MNPGRWTTGHRTTGYWIAALLCVTTIALIVIGTLWPVPAALAFAGGTPISDSSSATAATAEQAVRNLGNAIGSQAWGKAYDSLANKAEFSQEDFARDLTGSYLSLRTNATMASFDVLPLHLSGDEGTIELRTHYSSVLGPFANSRTVRVVKTGNLWKVAWPLVKEQHVPPQVIAVKYLRWDVIYPGAGDGWGVQSVEGPHIRIVDMHPVQRADGVVILGELINEDVVPAYVSVKATLQAKNGAALATEGSFDKIAHTLLPKQVTPFLITFPDRTLAGVSSIRMDPVASLIPASADPVIVVEDQKLNPAPDASLAGQLVNQSGQVVNFAHVLATFYDKSGQVVWIADRYLDRALLPQTPAPFDIHIPEDLARKISSQRMIVATYSLAGVS